MKIKVRKSATMREQPEEGVHFARVVGICDLGHQPGFVWAGGEADSAYKMELTYELVNAKMEDGRPFWVSEEVTNSDNERSKLRARVVATKSSFEDLGSMIDRPVMVTVEHNEKGYAKITNVAGVPTGTEVAPLSNDPVLFSIYDEDPNLEVFRSFPEFKRNKFTSALDFEGTALEAALLKGGDMDNQEY